MFRLPFIEIAIGLIGAGISMVAPNYAGYVLIVVGVIMLLVALYWPRLAGKEEKKGVVLYEVSIKELPHGIVFLVWMALIFTFIVAGTTLGSIYGK